MAKTTKSSTTTKSKSSTKPTKTEEPKGPTTQELQKKLSLLVKENGKLKIENNRLSGELAKAGQTRDELRLEILKELRDQLPPEPEEEKEEVTEEKTEVVDKTEETKVVVEDEDDMPEGLKRELAAEGRLEKATPPANSPNRETLVKGEPHNVNPVLLRNEQRFVLVNNPQTTHGGYPRQTARVLANIMKNQGLPSILVDLPENLQKPNEEVLVYEGQSQMVGQNVPVPVINLDENGEEKKTDS